MLLNVGINLTFDIEHFILIVSLNNSSSSNREQRIIRNPHNIGSNVWDKFVSCLLLCVFVSSDIGDLVRLAIFYKV